MTDFTARQSQQPAQQPQRPQMPVAAARPPYFDFNDIFGSAGKKPSPPVTSTATTAATTSATTAGGGGPGTATGTPTIAINHHHHHNNNNSNNNNNNNNSVKQSSAAGVQQQQSAAATGCCPVCGTALRTAHELESHFVWELERLYKQAAVAGRRHRRGTPDKMGDHHHGQLMVCARDGGGGRLSPIASGSRDGSLHGRWETYQKVKANRHNRLRIKNRKRKPEEMLLAPSTCCCPVCNEPITAATQEQMNAHVEMCLRNKGHPAVAVTAVTNDDEDENVDVEGDTDTTMYDIVYGGVGGWPGQQQHNRIRQQPMILHRGVYNRGAAAMPTAINCSTGNPQARQSAAGEDSTGPEDVVLVVDDNDGTGSLYKQNDPNSMETMDSCENVGPLDVSIKKENTQEDGNVMKPKMDIDKYCGQFNNNGQMVEALKARIRELESVSKTGADKFTCLLCKGNFKDPVVSTSCWHVYCEVCWLQILGAKKLCPQCYVITLPSHLRRVYL
ncbi:Hypothetical protein CINCED_3A021017 [Cinara cedri]|uniref:RING-type domain-containing protein n=1 Tax=Cinara cedri TaxID=506608 RepID=A0A5E4LY81_9HEMI|nr:Hypothetical protein CINCED_3A021017 [Cinara cedri]